MVSKEERDHLRSKLRDIIWGRTHAVTYIQKLESCFDDLDALHMEMNAPEVLEIQIAADGKTIWINGPECCLFRACKIGKLIVKDERDEKAKET